MRLLAVSDLQLGAHLQYADERLAEQEQVWQTALDLALDHDCDCVLFAGDATETRAPSSEVRAAFQRPLVGYPLSVIAINGNHDVRHQDMPSAIELAGQEIGGGLLIASKRPELITPPGLPMFVATLPHVTTGWIRSRQEQVDTDEANLTAALLLLSVARGLRAEASEREPSWPCVLLGHFPTTGWATPTGFATAGMGTVVLPLDDVQALGFDAAILGDIHLPGVIADEPLVLSPGSPFPVDFGESGCDHGAWVVDVEQGNAEATFLPIASREFVTLDLWAPGLDIPREPDPDEAARVRDAIVRVQYTATAEQARRISNTAIRQTLLDAGAHRVFIEPTIVREQRARVAGLDETIDDNQALAMWLQGQKVDPGLAVRLRDRHGAYQETLA